MGAINMVTPPWIARADRAYGIALQFLLPQATRSDAAGLMRQAFRDRCREVSRGGRSLGGLLLGEILPDLMHAVWLEHFAAPAIVGRRRWLGWGAAIAATLAIAISANAIGDWFWRHYNPPRMFYLANKEKIDGRRDALRGFLDYLDTRPQPDAQVAGLWLRALLHENYLDLPGPRSEQERQEEVREARAMAQRINALAIDGLEPAALGALADACVPEDGCHRDRVLAALAKRAPGNGYFQLYRLRELTGSRREDEARAAMATLAGADYVDGREAEWMRTVLAWRDRFGGTNPAQDRALLEITSFLGRLQPGYFMVNAWCVKPTWLTQPAVASDCARVAALFERSGNSWGMLVAARIRAAQAVDDSERAAEQSEVDRLHRYMRYSVPESFRPEDEAAVARWVAAWRGANTEAEARRRWFAGNDSAARD